MLLSVFFTVLLLVFWCCVDARSYPQANPYPISSISPTSLPLSLCQTCDPAYRHLHQHARGALHTFEAVSAHAAATGD